MALGPRQLWRRARHAIMFDRNEESMRVADEARLSASGTAQHVVANDLVAW